MEGPRVCKTVLLPDLPVEEDEFSGGAHRRLAEALADMITNEPESRAIALEGSCDVLAKTVEVTGGVEEWIGIWWTAAG